MNYVGRFAPSPSGPLHFGSLVAALGSYFQAKANQGDWLVRIEDLDPPREVPGATQQILQALECYGLEWDGQILYQSQRHDFYQAQIDQWLAKGEAYYCTCSRKEIKAMGGYYTGLCRTKLISSSKDCAVRIKMQHPVTQFNDVLHGNTLIPFALAGEDFIIKRRDGLFAYNLAVVLDDIAQEVTEVVRGADLIEPTGRQMSLYRILGHQPIQYLHLPLAMAQEGRKLSKQNHAAAIDISDPRPTLIQAMRFLGFQLPQDVALESVATIVDWGCNNWQICQLPNETEIIL
ncbi:tRNA glutamyl-Q(34) synthetase GluQRS [Vibrio sp. RC27]